MRKSSWALLGVAALAAGVYESAFVSSAPWPVYFFRPVLPACVMLFLLNRRTAAYVTAALAGGVISLLSAAPSGWILGRWMIVLLIIDVLSERVATNRSLYAALALVVVARVFDRLLWQIFSWFSLVILHQASPIESWAHLLWVTSVDMLLAALVFIAITLFTKRFVIAINPRKERYEQR